MATYKEKLRGLYPHMDDRGITQITMDCCVAHFFQTDRKCLDEEHSDISCDQCWELEEEEEI